MANYPPTTDHQPLITDLLKTHRFDGKLPTDHRPLTTTHYPLTMQLRYTTYLLIAAGIVAADQLTKYAAAALWQHGSLPLDVLPFLQLVLVFNRGAAFGFLNQAGGWQVYLLSGVAIALSLALLVWLWRVHRHRTLLALALSLILAGAVGNLFDRLQYHYVIDFISLYYHDWRFPAFNVADISISIGAVLLLVEG